MPDTISITISRSDCADHIREAVRAALPEVDASSIQVDDTSAVRDLSSDGLTKEQVRRAWHALKSA